MPLTLRALSLSLLVFALPASAHDVYVVNDNHTDYGWNDSTAHYDEAMLDELDHALEQLSATSTNATREQARFNADGWFYLWLYERDRSPQQFEHLLSAIRSGHITVPLNPFVELFGAMPTEAAIRAGYYPGRLERAHQLSFPLAQDVENQTMPWGLASLWAGSGVKYAWKGICGCDTAAPYQDHQTDLFHWEGPDGKQLLVKWYEFSGNNRSFGGYAEARDNLSDAGLEATLARDKARALPVSGLFGAGWDDVRWTTGGDVLVPLAINWNATHPDDKVVLSNGLDYFEAVNQSGATLPTLRGGWGNDWELWPATLAERTAQTRQAVEQLRTAEAMAAVVHAVDPGFWPPRQTELESAWTDYFKYFEHTWSSSGAVSLTSVVANKRQWAKSFAATVQTTDDLAQSAFSQLFATPNGELRVVVFNPLGHTRTDVARVVTPAPGPFIVSDVETGAEVPTQSIGGASVTAVEFIAREVPSLGYRIYRLTPGTPQARPAAATLSGTTFENDRYRLILGSRGQLIGLVHKPSGASVAGQGLNDFGSGASSTPTIESQGPVSVTVRIDISGTPSRREHLTLFASEVDRIEIDDEIIGALNNDAYYRFAPDSALSRIRFEELGAIATPGLAAQGGDFLPGTRADFLTLNHFIDFSSGSRHLVLSSTDAYLAQLNQSTPSAFDVSGSSVRVLAAGNPGNSPISDQGGEAAFRTRFALRLVPDAFSASVAMRTALEHQNPLRTILLSPGQTGPLTASTMSFATVTPDDVVLLAFKPAEDPGQGIVARLWELDGQPATVKLELAPFAPVSANRTSLIETDTGPLAVAGSAVELSLGANELGALRFVPGPGGALPIDGGSVIDDDGGVGATDAGLTDPPDAAIVGADGGGVGNVHFPGCGCQGTPAALIPLLALGVLAISRRRHSGSAGVPRFGRHQRTPLVRMPLLAEQPDPSARREGQREDRQGAEQVVDDRPDAGGLKQRGDQQPGREQPVECSER